MGDIKAGDPFGLDKSLISSIDWDLALKRVVHDLRTDFIYAPHLSFIYNRARSHLIDELKSQLKAGTYSPSTPMTIEVPKSFRMTVAAQIKRLGPNYSRPGSILLPQDRLLYQAIADQAAPIIENKTNKLRSFSHRLDPANGPSMFVPTRICWSALQKAMAKYSAEPTTKYVIKLDVANFFGTLNQHELVNFLGDSGLPNSINSRLEALLIAFTGDRSSRGLLQGMYPSDLFGNFYLAPIDALLEEHEVYSARYVDDIYVFVTTMKNAERVLRDLIHALRSYDLTLNEAKSKILLKTSLLSEEPDLEALFQSAVDEIASQLDDEDFDVDYGFQAEWDDDENDDNGEEEDKSEKLELAATTSLFDSIDEYAGHEENIERFCLPLFAKAGSVYAVDHVKEVFKRRPAMTQIYCAYLASFINKSSVQAYLLQLLEEDPLVDWQRMWVLATLLQISKASDASVKVAMDILKDGDSHDALRAVAAIYVGRFGDHTRRKSLVQLYANVTPYVQCAIYFSSRNWPSIERTKCKATWANQTKLNIMMTKAFASK